MRARRVISPESGNRGYSRDRESVGIEGRAQRKREYPRKSGDRHDRSGRPAVFSRARTADERAARSGSLKNAAGGRRVKSRVPPIRTPASL